MRLSLSSSSSHPIATALLRPEKYGTDPDSCAFVYPHIVAIVEIAVIVIVITVTVADVVIVSCFVDVTVTISKVFTSVFVRLLCLIYLCYISLFLIVILDM